MKTPLTDAIEREQMALIHLPPSPPNNMPLMTAYRHLMAHAREMERNATLFFEALTGTEDPDPDGCTLKGQLDAFRAIMKAVYPKGPNVCKDGSEQNTA